MSALPPMLISALFGGMGVAMRVLMILLCTERQHLPLRWTILVVNLTGSACAGACTAGFSRVDPDGIARAAVIGGILGGFTTFSSFAIECIEQWQRGARRRATLHAIGSLLGCAASAWLGFEIVRRLWP
jgi:CrcB protein